MHVAPEDNPAIISVMHDVELNLKQSNNVETAENTQA